MDMEEIAGQTSSFGGRRRSAGVNNRPARQSVVGQIVEYQVGDRNKGASLDADRLVVRLMHPVPAWGIDGPDDNGDWPVVTVAHPRKKDERSYDIHTMRWGGKNANMAKCDTGSFILFENCYFLAEGKSTSSGLSAPPGGLVVAEYVSPLARPIEMTGDPENQLPAKRYVMPYSPVMVPPGYIDKKNGGRNSSQKAVIALGGLPGGLVQVTDAKQELTALKQVLDSAAQFGSLGNIGVLCIARKNLDLLQPEERLAAAEKSVNSVAFASFARRLRATVTPEGKPYVATCTKEGMADLIRQFPQASVKEISVDAVMAARNPNEAQKDIMAIEASMADLGHYEISVADRDDISRMTEMAAGDLQIYAGPPVRSFTDEGKTVSLGVQYVEGVRHVAAAFAQKAKNTPISQMAINSGYTVEFMALLESKLLPSLTAGHPEKKSEGSLDRAFRIYESMDNAKVGSTDESVALPGGGVAAVSGHGFNTAHIALSLPDGGAWKVRTIKVMSDGSLPFKPDEMLTPNTAPEFADAFHRRQMERHEIMMAVRESRRAIREAEKGAEPAPDTTPAL